MYCAPSVNVNDRQEASTRLEVWCKTQFEGKFATKYFRPQLMSCQEYSAKSYPHTILSL